MSGPCIITGTMHWQVYLVTGGYFGILDRADTEILVHGASAWARAGPLPQGVSGIRAVSVDNSIIATGRGTLITNASQ